MVKQKVVIDSDIIIDYLRQRRRRDFKSQLRKIIEGKDIIPLISVATIQELFAGRSSQKAKEEKEIRAILALLEVKDVTKVIAEIAGKILRDAKPIVKFADAQIAATVILENAYLVTKNKKDFQSIKGLKFYEKTD